MSRKPLRHKLSTGFTLVELLVALFVFSLISGFAYKAINTLVKSGDVLEAEMKALASVQRTVQSIERDLRQKSVPVLANTETEAISLSPDKTQLELTLVPSSLATKQQALKHIRYRLVDKSLVREVWKNNKSVEESPDEIATLLKDITSVEFVSLDQAAASTTKSWPTYFQIALEHEQLGVLKRIIYFGVNEPERNFSSLTESTGNSSGSSGKPCPGSTNPNC